MLLTAFAVSAMAQMHPNVAVLDLSNPHPKKTYEVVKVENFDIVTMGFSDIWDRIPNVDTIHHRDFNKRTATDDADLNILWKAAYDADYLYILADITDNEIHPDAIADVYDGDDKDGNPKYKSASDGIEFMWTTYPEYYEDVYNADSSDRWNTPAFGRWNNVGSYKTGWKLKNTAEQSVAYDGWSDVWDWDNNMPVAFDPAWKVWSAISYGNPLDGCESKVENISTTNMTFFAAIPFVGGMAGLVPSAGDQYGLEIKYDDVDESTKSEGTSSNTWNSTSNDVWFAAFYAGIIEFTDVSVFPVGVKSYSADMNLSVYPNPAVEMLNIEMNDINTVEIYNIVGRVVKSADFNKVNKAQLSVSDLSEGVYFVTVNGNQTSKFVIE